MAINVEELRSRPLEPEIDDEIVRFSRSKMVSRSSTVCIAPSPLQQTIDAGSRRRHERNGSFLCAVCLRQMMLLAHGEAAHGRLQFGCLR